MKIIKGQFNNAKIFTDNVDSETIDQVKTLLNQSFIKDSQIRIMPDCHAGAGCVIGTTMTIIDKVVPNLVGVDIGCGMLTVELGNIAIDLNKLDQFITKEIPSKMQVHNKIQTVDIDITKLKCWEKLSNKKYYYESMGTLGGGNHFIEIDVDENCHKYLIIHSGSRNLGLQIANHYQDLAISYQKSLIHNKKKEIAQMIKEYKAQNRTQEIQKKLSEISSKEIKLAMPESLCYLEGDNFNDYLHDMDIAQKYASENRLKMAMAIVNYLGIDFKTCNYFQTIHNYINMTDMILRKGAISALENEKVLIPINMRDGCIIGYGKGNPDYNYSGPHGAGRLMSRSKAKDINLDDFIKTMAGIYSTSVCRSTLDESPFVYKTLDDILMNIKDTITVDKIIKPIYNFKAK